MMVGMIALLATVFSKEPRRYPFTAVTVLLVGLAVWTTITSVFALTPQYAWPEWSRVIKTLFMVIITIMVINTEADLKKMTWILALSLAVFGIKGGVFTLASGGAYRVLGPAGSYIAENNSLALALVMAVPMIWCIRLQAEKRWLRHALAAAAVLTVIAAAGSYSRGALLAGGAMMIFLWLKSRNKVSTGLILLLMIPVVLLAMPEQWHERMVSIGDYQTDSSALGRINAWYFAMEVARQHILGGGFMVFNPGMFRIYAPNPMDYHAAHSIYFQVLGEHGYIGLAIFLSLIVASWHTANRIIRSVKGRPDMKWASDFAAMSQVSILGYMVGGAFLSLAYYDYFYYVVAALVITQKIVAAKKVLPVVEAHSAVHGVTQESTRVFEPGSAHART
jgi:probable O-glycosylation ligase (exosortase A-associated)